MNDFFANYGLIILLVVLLVFMFWSSRRRMAKQKLEQEERARNTVPGAEVLMQGGLYGRIVSYDPENLDQPAVVEIAPGVDIKVHSQAILRIVTPTEAPELDEVTPLDDVEVVEDDFRAVEKTDVDPDSESGTKPQA